MYTARLVFQDGKHCDVPVAAEQTLLEAAVAAGAPLRNDCWSGSCGSCLVRVPAGTETADEDATVLTAAERAAGLRTACTTRLRSDASFQLPYPYTPAPSEPARHRALVSRLEPLSAGVTRLTLRLDEAEDFRFRAGQYLRLRPPGARQTRAYSIANAPASGSEVELLIRHVPGGLVTGWLESTAQAGEQVALHGPLGAFGLDCSATRHVFIAGGTGLAPMLSMLRELGDGQGDALLCFGCSRPERLFYVEELLAMAAARPWLDLRIRCSGGATLPVRSGRLVESVTADDLSSGTAAYLCGPPGMVEAASARLVSCGLDPAAIRSERFVSSA